MAGHSKWAQIKHKKGAADQKRGQLFSKLLNAVAVAGRENQNPDANPRLRSAIEKARAANVPNENIERALKKSGEAKHLSEITIEAYGPEKSAILIQGITDNSNRTVAAVRKILEAHGAKVADPGSVLWAFEHVGGSWAAKFKQSVSSETMEKLNGLIRLLEEHADVDKVLTNIE